MQAQAQIPAAQSQVSGAQARVQEAQARLSAASVVRPQHQVSEAQFLTANADIGLKQAALKQAQLNLSYCVVRAPVDGKIAHKTIQVGNYVTAGSALMAVLGPDVWVTANFKETQLVAIKAGNPVEIHVDASFRARSSTARWTASSRQRLRLLAAAPGERHRQLRQSGADACR